MRMISSGSVPSGHRGVSASAFARGAAPSRPTTVAVRDLGGHCATIAVEALQRGFGHTLGRALQRAVSCARRASDSPVRRIGFEVDPVRAGMRSGLDRLVLRIETNGAMPPDRALHEAAVLLIAQWGSLAESPEGSTQPDAGPAEVEAWWWEPNPLRAVDELGLTMRSFRCLKAAGVDYIADMIQRTDAELLRLPHLGRQGLAEIKLVLASHGLQLRTR